MSMVLHLVAASALVTSAAAYDNGMAKKPPMGWQTWCSVGPCGEDHCTEFQIRAMADTLVAKDASSGVSMLDLGYSWIVLDDCWHPHRDANGSLVPFPRFFPNGMKSVIDYVHSLGLTFGLYTSVGDVTCHGGWSPGSLGYWQQDADTFASWGVDYVKIDYCGNGTDPSGHRNMSKAMNATGRPMVLALCRGPYQREKDWGYAREVAQVWRAAGDHHDSFSSVIEEVTSVKGKSAWSGPHNWAYLDMMMTGGQGCKGQCVGGLDDKGSCNYSEPQHCPGQTDNEYRTEASLYAIVSSPMMIGTDIRLMTPIMRELLLNPEVIALNQDFEAVPGDAVMGCGSRPPPRPQPPPTPPPPATCTVTLTRQDSRHECRLNKTFGCDPTDTREMWVDDGCRGEFLCNGFATKCGHKDSLASSGPQAVPTKCKCDGAPTPLDPESYTLGEVWVRHMSNGDLAVAMPNLGNAPAAISICLDAIGWKHGKGTAAKVRDMWKRKDLGLVQDGMFTATVDVHDTLLLRIAPQSFDSVGLSANATRSPACQKRMDEYCSTRAATTDFAGSGVQVTCKEALGKVGCNTTILVARHDLLGAGQWRCFSPSALDSSLSKYASNATGSHCYCTRNNQLASLCSGPPAPGPPRGFVSAFISGHDGYHTYRIPSLVKLMNGDLLLFAEGRKLSSSDHGWNDIVMKRSSDNGQGWSEQVKVWGESNATKSVCIGNPAPIGRKDGTVVLVACRDNSEVLVLRSNVLATNWSNATYVTDMVKAPAWTWIATGPPQGLELPSGRLLVAADHIGKGGVWGSHAMFSDDGGSSWAISSANGAAAPPGKNWSGPLSDGNECQVAVAPNNSLLMNMRTRSGVRQFSWSVDGKGEKWTPPTAAPFAFAGKYAGGGTEGSTLRVPGSDLLLFSTPFSQHARANLTIFRSTTNGATWEFERQVDSGSAAYSALIDINKTHYGVAWESSNYGAISFQALPLPTAMPA